MNKTISGNSTVHSAASWPGLGQTCRQHSGRKFLGIPIELLGSRVQVAETVMGMGTEQGRHRILSMWVLPSKCCSQIFLEVLRNPRTCPMMHSQAQSPTLCCTSVPTPYYYGLQCATWGQEQHWWHYTPCQQPRILEKLQVAGLLPG